MAFHEVRFPTSISRGSSGGPTRLTDIVTLRSGHEERNTIWNNSRRVYDAGIGLRDLNDLYDVVEFFEARRGQLHAFRFKDWSDYRSGRPTNPVSPDDVILGVGDGLTTEFRLSKTYSDGGGSYTRFVTKPVEGSVVVALNSQPKSGFSVDVTTGVVTLDTAPESGVRVSAGFEFDVPVRFNQDQIMVSVEQFNAGSVPQIEMIEVRK